MFQLNGGIMPLASGSGHSLSTPTFGKLSLFTRQTMALPFHTLTDLMLGTLWSPSTTRLNSIYCEREKAKMTTRK